MEKTLLLVRELRPRASWGYFGLPHVAGDSASARNDDDRVSWLWRASDVILPSVYYVPTRNMPALVAARVTEARRCATAGQPVFAYASLAMPGYSKTGKTQLLTSQAEMCAEFAAPALSGATGLIVWGPAKASKGAAACSAMGEALKHSIGPFLRNVSRRDPSLRSRCKVDDAQAK